MRAPRMYRQLSQQHPACTAWKHELTQHSSDCDGVVGQESPVGVCVTTGWCHGLQTQPAGDLSRGCVRPAACVLSLCRFLSFHPEGPTSSQDR